VDSRNRNKNKPNCSFYDYWHTWVEIKTDAGNRVSWRILVLQRSDGMLHIMSQLVQLVVLWYAIFLVIRISIKRINKCLSALERTDVIFQTDGLIQVYSICQQLVVLHLMDPDDGDKAGTQNTGGQKC
jgi:hypothetical protein